MRENVLKSRGHADRVGRACSRVSISLPIVVRFRIAGAVLATALSSQCRFDPHLLPRLQVKCVTLDVLDDVLIKNLTLEAFERAFQTLAIDNLHFCQRNSPQFLNYHRRFQGSSFRAITKIVPNAENAFRTPREIFKSRAVRSTARSMLPNAKEISPALDPQKRNRTLGPQFSKNRSD
jgi:hypothetical protein